MGRPWRIFPTLCLAASVVSVRGQGNEQKPIAAQEPTASGNPLTSEFAEFVLQTLDEYKVPGVAVAVVDGDEIYAEVSVSLYLYSHTYMSNIESLMLFTIYIGLRVCDATRCPGYFRDSMVWRLDNQIASCRGPIRSNSFRQLFSLVARLGNAHFVHHPRRFRPTR